MAERHSAIPGMAVKWQQNQDLNHSVSESKSHPLFLPCEPRHKSYVNSPKTELHVTVTKTVTCENPGGSGRAIQRTGLYLFGLSITCKRLFRLGFSI